MGRFDYKERAWRTFASRGVKVVCSQEDEGWHMYKLVDGAYLDAGLCGHDHDRVPGVGSCVDPPGFKLKSP